MIVQFKQDLYNKTFSRQDHGKADQIDSLRNIIKFWLKFIDMGGQMPGNFYVYDYNNDGLDGFVRGA